MHAPPRSARALLAVGIGLGVANLVVLPLARPDQVGLATTVYTVAAEAALAGEPFYGVAPAGLPGYRFVYPPVVMVAMLPLGVLGDPWLAFAGQTALTLVAGLALAWLFCRFLGRAGVALATVDRGLVTGFVLVGLHSTPTLVNGQLNLLLGLAVAVGFIALERDRATLAGTALALAATVKLFPALFGGYLLRQRAWRAIGAALATGIGLVALGVAAFGLDATVTYATVVVPGEAQTGALATEPLEYGFLTVRRQLAAVLPWLPAAWLPGLAVLVVAPVVAVTYWRLETLVDRLLALLATVIGTLLVLPLEGLYFPLAYVALVPLLFVLPTGRSRTLFLVGTALTMIQLTPPAVAALASGGLLPQSLATGLAVVTDPLFRVVLPPTVGMWLLLGAGLHWQRWGRPARADPATADDKPPLQTD